MSMTGRDKKIILIIVPLLAVVAFWFLLLSPKRQEAAKAGEELSKQEQRRDRAQEKEQALDSAKTGFASDYRELVRLGKAVPTSVDMPSLLIQLDTAARGTGIHFEKITAGPRQGAAAAASTGGSQPGQGQQAPSSGGSQKSSGSSGSGQSGSTDTQTSTAAKSGGVPVGGGASAPAGGGQAGAGQGGAPGLETVPLELKFTGNFFRLADFFHRLKRFVRVVNSRVLVHGRLMTIDSLDFGPNDQGFPALKAEIKATVYLTPKAQATAGAGPQGPPQSQPAASDGGSAPQPSTSQPPAPAATTAR
jgi:Tfp pilus assembly protein PilO